MSRKIQYHAEDSKMPWTYFVPGERNACGCGANNYHYEFDGKHVLAVCSSCGADLFEISPEHTQERLDKGVWKLKEVTNPQTNAEHYRSMSDEQLAELFSSFVAFDDSPQDVRVFYVSGSRFGVTYQDAWLRFLRQPRNEVHAQ